MLELIEPRSEKSPVYKFLQERGGGLHHLSYNTAAFDATVAGLRAKKCIPISREYPGAGHGGARAIWLFTPNKEIIEIMENTTKGMTSDE